MDLKDLNMLDWCITINKASQNKDVICIIKTPSNRAMVWGCDKSILFFNHKLPEKLSKSYRAQVKTLKILRCP